MSTIKEELGSPGEIGKSLESSKSFLHSAEASPKEDGKNRGWPKGKKRYPKGPGAPKQPLSGYVHYLNARRDAVRKENPDLSFADISKRLAYEWSNLEASEKKIYVKKADDDRERYNREFSEYQTTDEYKEYLASQKATEKNALSSASSSSKKKKSLLKDGIIKAEPESPKSGGTTLDIPIFSEEFLEHNRSRENELKLLRKKATEFEEQNAILQKHVENMKSAITRMEIEEGQHKENNLALEKHLEALRKLVIVNFGGLTLPTPATPTAPLTMDNVDEFVHQLHNLVVDNPQDNERIVAVVKDLSMKIDYSSVST